MVVKSLLVVMALQGVYGVTDDPNGSAHGSKAKGIP